MEVMFSRNRIKENPALQLFPKTPQKSSQCRCEEADKGKKLGEKAGVCKANRKWLGLK